MTFTLDEMQQCVDATNWDGPSATRLPARGYVYFIAEGTHGAVKIGWTEHPAQRLNTMQIGNSRPLYVLGLIEDGEESRWHNRFKAQRIAGEWFRRSPDLIAAISESRTHMLTAHVHDGRTRRGDRIVAIDNWTPELERKDRKAVRALRGRSARL